MKKYFKYAVMLLSATMVLASCDDDENGKGKNSGSVIAKNGAYVINQGLYGSNNASVSFINFDNDSVSSGVFMSANGRSLGDNAQDAVACGNKMYIAVYGSNTIEVVTLDSLKSVKVINTEGDGGPRDIIAYGGKVYVSLYDGRVCRIDTASLTIDAVVEVGPNPEEMAVANGFLYVANSDGMNYADSYKNGMSVSKIDLASFSEVKKIPVAMNPCDVVADASGNVYVISMGDYFMTPVVMQKIDKDDNVSEYKASASIFDTDGGVLYTVRSEYGNPDIAFVSIDAATGDTISAKFLSGELPLNPTFIRKDKNSGKFYLGSYASSTDFQSNGFLFEYAPSGEFLKKYNVGIGPFGLVVIK